MNEQPQDGARIELAAVVGIDWADKEHAVCLQPANGEKESSKLAHKPEALAQWARGLRERFPNQLIGVCLEQSRGPMIYALSKFPWIILYPINPKSLARYRESLFPSRSKSDPADAALLCDYLTHHQERLRPWKAEDAHTRHLRFLLENRETLVDDRTRITHRLRDQLKLYFPQVIEWAGPLTKPMSWDFLLKWPCLSQLKKASKKTLLNFFYAHHVRRGDQISDLWPEIQKAEQPVEDSALEQSAMLLIQGLCRQLQVLQLSIRKHDQQIAALYAEHPEKSLFDNLPGAGPVLAPRLIVAFGTDRTRFTAASQLQQLSGIAPVTEQSGKSTWVHWRWAAASFLRQSFHEFAAHSITSSRWARAYYQKQILQGKKHHAAVRALAYKWIRILFRCWQTQTPYDEARYLAHLASRGSPLVALIASATTSP